MRGTYIINLSDVDFRRNRRLKDLTNFSRGPLVLVAAVTTVKTLREDMIEARMKQ